MWMFCSKTRASPAVPMKCRPNCPQLFLYIRRVRCPEVEDQVRSWHGCHAGLWHALSASAAGCHGMCSVATRSITTEGAVVHAPKCASCYAGYTTSTATLSLRIPSMRWRCPYAASCLTTTCFRRSMAFTGDGDSSAEKAFRRRALIAKQMLMSTPVTCSISMSSTMRSAEQEFVSFCEFSVAICKQQHVLCAHLQQSHS